MPETMRRRDLHGEPDPANTSPTVNAIVGSH